MECPMSTRIELLEEGDYLATSEVLPGFLAQGRSIAETIETAQDVARKLIESYLDHGDPVPEALLAESNRDRSVELSIPVPVVL